MQYTNGVFIVSIEIAGNTIDAVVDTGSQRLVVSSDTCSECLGGAIPPPQDRSLHRLYYGTQNEVVRWGVYDVEMFGFLHSGHRPPAGSIVADTGVLYPKVNVAVTMERSGSSNYNILGLSMPNLKTQHPSVLEMFMGPRPQLSFTILLWCQAGWLIFGPPPQQYTFNYVPFVRNPMAKGFVYQFYVVEAQGMWCGDTQIAGPHYLMIDTGSNMLSLPAESLKRAHHAGIGRGKNALSIKMGTVGGNTAQMSFPAAIYTWDDGSLLLEEEPHDARIDRPVVIVGSLFLQNFAMHFDVANGRIGIAEL
jgi:hypothetical protein